MERFLARGLTVEAGLKALIRDGGTGLGQASALVYGKTVVEQRCIFHKLKNVKESLSNTLSAAVQKQLMSEAKAI